jgi:hypothetical protein
MTKHTTVSVKIPDEILKQMPAAGNGRSGFMLKAIEDKIAQCKGSEWKPKSARGRRLAVFWEKGRIERARLLPDRQIEEELRRKGGRTGQSAFSDTRT